MPWSFSHAPTGHHGYHKTRCCIFQVNISLTFFRCNFFYLIFFLLAELFCSCKSSLWLYMTKLARAVNEQLIRTNQQSFTVLKKQHLIANHEIKDMSCPVACFCFFLPPSSSFPPSLFTLLSYLRSSSSSGRWWCSWFCLCAGSQPAGHRSARWWSSPDGGEPTPSPPGMRGGGVDRRWPEGGGYFLVLYNK